MMADTYDTSALHPDYTVNLALGKVLEKKADEGEGVPALFDMIAKQKNLESQMKARKSEVGDTPAISAIEDLANVAMKQTINAPISGAIG